MFRRVFLIIFILFVTISPLTVSAQRSGIMVREVSVEGKLTNEYFNSSFRAGTDSYFTVPGNADIKIIIPNGETDQKIYVYSQPPDPNIAKSRLMVRFSADAQVFSAQGSVEHLNSIGNVIGASNSSLPAGNSASAAQNSGKETPAPAVVAPVTTDSKVAADAKAATKCSPDGPQGLIDPKCTLAENLNHLYPITVRIIVLLAFLAVIYAGYLYITSFGKEERITEAKNWVIAAITGLALILLVPVVLDTLEIIKKQLPATSGTAAPVSGTPASSDSSSNASSSGTNAVNSAKQPAPTTCIPQGSIESGGITGSGVPC